ncbi:MAG: hypothetical protein R3A80_05630 [Bdellovibrionota bacterium]
MNLFKFNGSSKKMTKFFLITLVVAFFSSCKYKDVVADTSNALVIGSENLDFESEDFDLENEVVDDYDFGFSTNAWFKFSYNSGTTPHAYITVNSSDSVTFAELSKDDLDSVTQADLDGATYGTSSAQCTSAKVFLLTKGDDIYLLRCTSEDGFGVDFEYALWP